MSHQVAQLAVEVVHIGRRAIVGLVAVPGREIERQLQPVLAAGFRQFGHNVTLAVLVGRPADVVVRALEGPQAETVVVLGGQDDSLHACRHKGLGPLLTVQPGGLESLGVGIPIPPFAVIEGVQAEMDEGISLHLLPGHLLGFGHG